MAPQVQAAAKQTADFGLTRSGIGESMDAMKSSSQQAPNRLATIMVVDDEESMRYVLSMNLQRKGYTIITAENGLNALELLNQQPPELVICDLKMPGMDGLELLQEITTRHPAVPVIMMTAFGTFDTAMEAVKRGAYDYCSKPIRTDELLFSVEKALERSRLLRENERLRREVASQVMFGPIVGKNRAMRSIYTIIEKVAPTTSTVLITGESGTGKELVARSIHTLSDRKDGPFIPLNCAALPAEIFESELFGHTRGAFTGAIKETEGLFQLANGGTLFLDEIGEIPLPSQNKLLRVLQDNEIRKVGGKFSTKLDVRLVAATEKNLAAMVESGNFSTGLYYRLRVVPIHLPPLRERPEDIPLLAEHFLHIYMTKYHKGLRPLTPIQIRQLLTYQWPGNVRELENWVERAVLMADGDELNPADFPEAPRRETDIVVTLPEDRINLPETLVEVTNQVERELIKRALQREVGNRTHAAKLLGISHRALLYKMKDYAIE